MSTQRFASFHDFYPLVLLIVALVTRTWGLLLAVPAAGYAFAWIGHFVFEKNKPATFQHPLYSLRGDFTMLRDVLTGRIRW
jgi:hypothetical protein